jgi:hypothetical protein
LETRKSNVDSSLSLRSFLSPLTLCCGSSLDTLALPWKASSLAWHIDFSHSRYRNQGTPSSPKSSTGHSRPALSTSLKSIRRPTSQKLASYSKLPISFLAQSCRFFSLQLEKDQKSRTQHWSTTRSRCEGFAVVPGLKLLKARS